VLRIPENLLCGAGVACLRELNSRYTHPDGWEIDLARRGLRLRGAPVPLGSRAFEIIEILVQGSSGG
jgi:DNA-binding winged helix-turn-helix (wHTH) protein